MKRNVIKLGQSTLVISLPNRWAEENGVKPKSEVDVIEEGDTLHVRTKAETRPNRTVTLEFSDKDWKEPRPEKYVQRMLATAYKQGMSTIIVKCKNKTILDYIESRVEGFIGLEIVEQRKDQLILKSVMESEESNFDTVLARAINLTLHIAQGSYDALKANDKTERLNLLRLERTHNKVTDYLKRALAMRRTTWEDKYLYSFVVEDERLIDEYKHLLGQKPSAKVLSLLQRTNEYVGLLLELYKIPSQENMLKLSQEYIPLRNQARALLEAKDSAVHLYNIIVATYELGETVIEWKMR